jgi:hypothetical protein
MTCIIIYHSFNFIDIWYTELETEIVHKKQIETKLGQRNIFKFGKAGRDPGTKKSLKWMESKSLLGDEVGGKRDRGLYSERKARGMALQ